MIRHWSVRFCHSLSLFQKVKRHDRLVCAVLNSHYIKKIVKILSNEVIAAFHLGQTRIVGLRNTTLSLLLNLKISGYTWPSLLIFKHRISWLGSDTLRSKIRVLCFWASPKKPSIMPEIMLEKYSIMLTWFLLYSTCFNNNCIIKRSLGLSKWEAQILESSCLTTC